MSTGLEQSLRSLLKSVLIEVARELAPSPQLQHQQQAPANVKSPTLLWRPAEAAKALAVSERLLWSLTRAGRVPSVRIGRLVRYDPMALREWVRDSDPTTSKDPTGLPANRQVATVGVRSARRARSASTPLSPDRPKQTAAADPRRQLPQPEKAEKGQPRDVRGFFAQRLGVDQDRLPRLTNGQLREIAGTDIGTLHGWIYLGRDLPDAAIERLQTFYANSTRE